MLVLLPPSEGKATTADGPPLDLSALRFPELAPARREVLTELVRVCSGPVDEALTLLGLTPGLAGEVTRNAGLATAPTLPAARVYTGVLHDALGLATLPEDARRRADRELLVFSGLWGILRPDDPVPPYRLPIGSRLPVLGGLARFWRVPLARVLPVAAGDGLVLDLRSSAYAAAWRPTGELAARTVTVRVVQELPDGRRRVVSHHNKATKGRLVRALLTADADPRDPAELRRTLTDLGFPAEESAPDVLDVVVREL